MKILVTLSAGMSLASWEKIGIASRELGYYNALSEHTGPIEFLSYGDPEIDQKILDKYENLSVRCVPFSPRIGRYSALSKSLYGPLLLKKNNDYNIIRSNQFDGAWTAMLTAERIGVPFILRCGYIFSKNYEKRRPGRTLRVHLVRKLEKFIASRAKLIIVTYEDAKKFFIDYHKVHPDKIHVIGNSIDVDLFRGCAATTKTVRDVVCVARHEPNKNLMTLIRACKDLGATLSLVGSGSRTEELKREAKRLNADVYFFGQIPNHELPAVLNDHKIFLLPSYYEGNPKALLEAMAASLPVIVSDIPEHRNIIRDGAEGLLCKTNAEDIKERLKFLLSNQMLRDSLASAARKLAIKKYSRSVNAAKEAKLLMKAVQ